METYLKNWDSNIEIINTFSRDINRLFILGRGPSLSTVWDGSLACKEAAKFPAEGIHAADFRHGPLELVSKDVTIIFLEGVDKTSKINRAFAEEISSLGANVIWVSPRIHPTLPTLLIPEVPDLFLPFCGNPSYTIALNFSGRETRIGSRSISSYRESDIERIDVYMRYISI